MHNKTFTIAMIISSLTLLSACSNDDMTKATDQSETIQESTTSDISKKQELEQTLSDSVTVAVEQAIANNDYRLFHSKGRRIVIPGLEHLELPLLKSQCGIKPMAVSGDVIKNAEQRVQRKAHYTHAKLFNQKMYKLCLKNQAQ